MIGYSGARLYPSDNFGPRKDKKTPRFIILHHTAMEDADAALERLCSPFHEVSAHYLITSAGEIVQLVSEDQRAWHAGRSFWQGEEDINSASIGIELDNNGKVPFSFPLTHSLVRLVGDIQSRWSILPAHVLGHFEIALGRKGDPSVKFDWRVLEQFGVAQRTPLPPWSQTRAETFLDAANALGYDVSQGTALVKQAFRQRYRLAHVKGPLSEADLALISALCAQNEFDDPSRTA